VLDECRAEFFYDLDLGLLAENFGIPFGHVCAGVFLEALSTVAAGHGFTVTETLRGDDLDFAAADRHQPLGTLALGPTEVTAAARDQLVAFRRRRTSRRPTTARWSARRCWTRSPRSRQAWARASVTPPPGRWSPN
jgi:hypothetical protein